MRSIRHPGPVSPVREQVAACRAAPLALRLRAGQSVNAAVTGALAEAGHASGYVDLDGVEIAPMHYVIPAPAPDASHVAWYRRHPVAGGHRHGGTGRRDCRRA